MLANIVDMNPIFRGNKREYLLTFTDSGGSAVPITGWTIYFTVKKNYADTVAAISKDITIHYDAPNGQTKILLTPTDTDIVPGNYFYDIQAKKAADDIETVLSGMIQIIAVTRKIT
ncbi:MAG TPA: hypothetical protein VMV86_01440 [Methanosarcinales archaeon]|nr:hypothetical protein [Methanosarcinales archaeon]